MYCVSGLEGTDFGSSSLETCMLGAKVGYAGRARVNKKGKICLINFM